MCVYVGRLSRFSSMASRQETTEPESQERPENKASETGARVCGALTCGAPGRTPRVHKASSSTSESADASLDPSSLPPPHPSLQSSGGGVNGASEKQPGAPAPCLRDGHGFLRLLQAETGRMDAWCQQMEQESKNKQLSEEGEELQGGGCF